MVLSVVAFGALLELPLPVLLPIDFEDKKSFGFVKLKSVIISPFDEHCMGLFFINAFVSFISSRQLMTLHHAYLAHSASHCDKEVIAVDASGRAGIAQS